MEDEMATTAFEIDDRIEAGAGDDREDGRIIEIHGERAMIAWRQGTRTWIALAECSLAD